MTVALVFHDEYGDPIHENEMIYDNFGAPIPNPGEVISIEGYSYKVVDRFFMYLSNLDINLQIIFRCEKLKK
ncbi:hypothetical protein [Bacillus infantis]|uniref:hypothetical protein n=1 Tax=Bacillus infantis TaxID=324767 RepID=UPI003CF66E11